MESEAGRRPASSGRGAVPPPPRLLSQAQAARLRTVRAAHARVTRTDRRAKEFGLGPVASRPAPSHPWVHVIHTLFRPATKQYRAADRLLTVRQASRQELADWSGLAGASVSNVVKALSDAGFEIRRRPETSRRVHFEVLGYDRDRGRVCGPAEAGTAAHARYLGHEDDLAVVEIEGQGRFRGRFLGPILPLSVFSGGAVLHNVIPGRSWVDLELGDRTHLVRLRIDGAGLDMQHGPWVS